MERRRGLWYIAYFDTDVISTLKFFNMVHGMRFDLEVLLVKVLFKLGKCIVGIVIPFQLLKGVPKLTITIFSLSPPPP